MKIGDLNSSGTGGTSSQPIVSSPPLSAYRMDARRNYQSGPDQVQLSSASAIASLTLSSHATRLSELKSAVSAGKYDPGASETAGAMLDETLARNS